MTTYNQKDQRWASLRLYNSLPRTTIGQSGCALTSVAMMDGRDPGNLNKFLGENSALPNGNMNWQKAAQLCNLDYDPTATKAVFYPTVACTDRYASSGVPQHFFILNANGTILDPIGGVERPAGYYKIISYRNLRPKPTPEEIKNMIKYYDQLSDVDKDWVRKFVQDFVANFYRIYFNRNVENQAMLDAHTNTILNDESGDGWNGIGHWIQGIMNDPKGEFYANWQKK